VRTSPLAALDKAEDLIVALLDGPSSAGLVLVPPEARETLRAIRAARAEILRQAVEAAETFRESTRRDPARRGTD
jgi:hypothetical protein